MPSIIGPFSFADLSAPPHLATPQMVARTRAGTNGVMVQNLGVKAMPFEVDSWAVVVTRTQGMNLQLAYQKLIGAPSLNVTWATYPYLLAGHRFFVLDVQPLAVKSVLNGIGITGFYGCEVHARWKLQPVTLTNS